MPQRDKRPVGSPPIMKYVGKDKLADWSRVRALSKARREAVERGAYPRRYRGRSRSRRWSHR